VSAVGDDVNPCTRTAPCRTFAAAANQTLPGGEIDAVDAGGFGALAVAKSVTIDGGSSTAAIANAGVHGIIVNAATTDVVTIRHLSIGGGGAGVAGIRIVQAKRVNIEDCEIFGQGIGIEIVSGAVASVVVRNTVVRDNIGDGLVASGGARGTVFNSTFTGNGAAGLHIAGANISFAVMGSAFTSNTGDGFAVDPSSSQAAITSSTFAFNSNGITAGAATGTPTVRISACQIFGNITNGIGGGGSVAGIGNNLVAGNGGSNALTSTGGGQ
jgi:hypothetical protein